MKNRYTSKISLNQQLIARQPLFKISQVAELVKLMLLVDLDNADNRNEFSMSDNNGGRITF